MRDLDEWQQQQKHKMKAIKILSEARKLYIDDEKDHDGVDEQIQTKIKDAIKHLLGDVL